MRGGRSSGAAAPLVFRAGIQPSALKHHGNVSPRILCGVLASACLLLACSAVPASAATNLVANPGFETQGAVQTVFSDTIPDGDAWRSASGGYTYGGNAITSFGIANTTDVAIIQYSQDWSDTTITVTTTPLATSANLVGGAMLRWQSGVGFYGCGVRSGALVIQRRSSSTDTVLGTTEMSVQAEHVVPGRLLRDRVDADLLGDADVGRRHHVPDPHRHRADVGRGRHVRRQRHQPDAAVPVLGAQRHRGGAQRLEHDRAHGRPARASCPTASRRPTPARSRCSCSGATTRSAATPARPSPSPRRRRTLLEAAISTIALTSGTARVVVTESPSGATTTLGGASGTTPWTRVLDLVHDALEHDVGHRPADGQRARPRQLRRPLAGHRAAGVAVAVVRLRRVRHGRPAVVAVHAARRR